MGLVNSILNLFRFNKRNWKAILLCIFAATVFWFFNALNKNYAANIGFALVFDYDQAKYVPAKPLPEKIRLNVSGNGWDLFRRSSGLKVPPLVIPLERPAEIKKIVGSSLPPLFLTQLDGLQINFVLTDTLYLDIDHKVKRMLKLKIDSAEQFVHRNYAITSPVKINPDSVLVEGPQRLVFGLPPVVSLPLPEDRIKNNYNDIVEVGLGSEYISGIPPVVRVSFKVEELSEVTRSLPVKVLNFSDRVRPVIEATAVSCTILTPLSRANSGAMDSAYAVLDVRSLPKGTTKVVPQVNGLPHYSRLIKVDTVKVIY